LVKRELVLKKGDGEVRLRKWGGADDEGRNFKVLRREWA